MKRIGYVAGILVLGAALLGVGVFLGNRNAAEQAEIAAANAQGPLTEKDALILSSFSSASANFEQLLNKAKDGKKVNDQLAQQAVIVLAVAREAEGPKFKEAVESAGQAMMLLTTGLVADDGATVQQGLDEYKASQELLVALAEEVQQKQNPEGESTGGDTTEGTPEQSTDGGQDQSAE